jgi:hypothetical protein
MIYRESTSVYNKMQRIWKQRVGGAIVGVGGFAMIITGIAFSMIPLIVVGVALFMVGALVVSFH